MNLNNKYLKKNSNFRLQKFTFETTQILFGFI
jgi:hypothetical protein